MDVNGVNIEVSGDRLCVDLCYPELRQIKQVEIDLVDTRAAYPIRVTFDFERNGWVITHMKVTDGGDDDDTVEWIEKAFIEVIDEDERD